MSNPIKNLFRRAALRRARSETPTALLPMKEVHSAVVFVDGMAANEDPAVAARLAQRLLADRGIAVQVFCPQKKDLDWLGRPKAEARIPDGEDLFLSLAASPGSFTADYEARIRNARFKVGRYALPGKVFDLVVASSGPAGPDDQAKALPAILEILDKVQ